MVTLADGSLSTLPPGVFTQFGVEIVPGTDGVGFRNVDGNYLAANMDWTAKSSGNQEVVFSPEIRGEEQAWRSVALEFLTIRDDGSLGMTAPAGELTQNQLFLGLRGENIEVEVKVRGCFPEISNCQVGYQAQCSNIAGYNHGGTYIVTTRPECLDLCCSYRACRSFDLDAGGTCSISTNTRNDPIIGNSYGEGTRCGGDYTEVTRERKIFEGKVQLISLFTLMNQI